MATKRKTKKEAPAGPEPKVLPSVGFFPVETSTLTPKAAAAWLEEESPQWHELIQLALQRADRDEKRALGSLTYYLGEMVRASALAVIRGKPLDVASDLHHARGFGDPSSVESLALVLRAVSRIEDDSTFDDLYPIAGPLQAIASALVRLARNATAEQRKLWKAEREERHQKRIATDPLYRAQAEAVERFRDASDQAASASRAAEGRAA